MSGKATMKSFKSMLSEAMLPECTVPICLRGDLVADFEETERLLEAAQGTRSDSLDGGDVGGLTDKIHALRALMREHTYTFRLRALSRREFRAVIAAHPPRRIIDGDGEEQLDERDRKSGFNAESMFSALVRSSVVDPVMDDADWSALEEKLTDRQYDHLADAAWNLNRADVDIPFSLADSLKNRSSAAA